MSFLKKIRLCGAHEFGTALKERRLAKGALFTLYASHTDNAPDLESCNSRGTHSKLGLIIGKRNAPLSVTRNTIKRVCREAFRCHFDELPIKNYVIRLHARVPNTSLTQLRLQVRTELELLLNKAKHENKPVKFEQNKSDAVHTKTPLLNNKGVACDN